MFKVYHYTYLEEKIGAAPTLVGECESFAEAIEMVHFFGRAELTDYNRESGYWYYRSPDYVFEILKMEREKCSK